MSPIFPFGFGLNGDDPLPSLDQEEQWIVDEDYQEESFQQFDHEMEDE